MDTKRRPIPLTNKLARRLAIFFSALASVFAFLSGFDFFEISPTIIIGFTGTALSFLSLPQARNMLETFVERG